MNKSFIKKLALIFSLTCLGGGACYFYHHQLLVAVQGPISNYEPARDRQDIINYYEEEKYWLTADPNSKVSFNLDYKSPNKSPLYFGTLSIKVLRENGQFAGFITYYKKSITKGYILHVGVKKKFRGKGFGRTLVDYALNDLKGMGISTVDLLTRTNNFSAQRLYNRIGFTETRRTEDGFVFFRKNL